MVAQQCRMILGFWCLRVKPNYQRISRKYPTAAFHLRNNRLGICRFDAELGRGITMNYGWKL